MAAVSSRKGTSQAEGITNPVFVVILGMRRRADDAIRATAITDYHPIDFGFEFVGVSASYRDQVNAICQARLRE
ncbi:MULTISPECIES: hypothetical protein [Sinorhizobium]|uniref:hypothetical protein n=1 Tax=Sinorhizobium TaxID=28105 RepID=UPI00119F1B1D|nr:MULTISPECIES: hypothetical protein [Sinorhizobium]MDW9439242.1 hypothetical protein [Sinorhizobium meliloti]MDW9484065.1 hypothetical protein [Sinorhizobium meliloti]MDX0523518.1 hypothetical protein [Sinorhizobium medicae]MDX0634241.1 hypothetical protein [Sinorhizobium medicae]MQV61381.1 hypothetical protein [Sinorhizobium meliloti]